MSTKTKSCLINQEFSPIATQGHFEMNCIMENRRTKIVKVRVTNLEYDKLVKDSSTSRCMSDYIRQRIFRHGMGLADPKEFIRSMDDVCLEMKRIGNNINQLAKYVNTHKDNISDSVIKEVEKQMVDYVLMQNKLNITWRKLMALK